MEFSHEFTVPAAPDAAWALLTDVPRIAPCLPGATVEPLADGGFEGHVTVRVGPVKVGYRGTARFAELDGTAHRMVLDAGGRESGGRGSAHATVTARLVAEGPERTKVLVATDLRITGRVAQFGRSAMADVGAALIGRFAENLAALLAAEGGGAVPAGPEAGPEARPETAAAPAAAGGDRELDALALVRRPARRAAVPAGAFLLGAAAGFWLSRRRYRRPATRCARPS